MGPTLTLERLNLKKFDSVFFVASRKDSFICIKFKENESINEFANQFYYATQILKGCGALTTFDAKLALIYALKPYPQLSIAMVRPLVGKCPNSNLVGILRQMAFNLGCNTLKRSITIMITPLFLQSAAVKQYFC